MSVSTTSRGLETGTARIDPASVGEASLLPYLVFACAGVNAQAVCAPLQRGSKCRAVLGPCSAMVVDARSGDVADPKGKRDRFVYSDINMALRSGRTVGIYTLALSGLPRPELESLEAQMIAALRPLWNGRHVALTRIGGGDRGAA